MELDKLRQEMYSAIAMNATSSTITGSGINLHGLWTTTATATKQKEVFDMKLYRECKEILSLLSTEEPSGN